MSSFRMRSAYAIGAMLLLSGCLSTLYGTPSSAVKKQAQEQAAGIGAVSGASSAKNSSSRGKKSLLQPQVIDMLAAQKKLRDRPGGYDNEDVVSTIAEIAQALLVTKEMKPHAFPDQDRIFYVISGQGTATINGQESAIRAGHMLVVPSGAELSIRPLGEQPMRFTVFKTPGAGSSRVEWVKHASSASSHARSASSIGRPSDEDDETKKAEEAEATGGR